MAGKYFVFYFLIVNKPHVQRQTNNEVILLISFVCVSKARYVLFLCAIDLQCCPKTIKNKSVALSDKFLRQRNYGHSNLFRNGSKDY